VVADEQKIAVLPRRIKFESTSRTRHIEDIFLKSICSTPAEQGQTSLGEWNEQPVTQYPSSTASVEIRDSRFRIWHNVLISGIALAAAFVLSINPDIFDRPLTGLINGFAGRSAFFDRLTFILFSSSTFCGAVLVALVWSCWFGATDPESRSHILVGTLASFGAGVISRFLQYTLPTHPRPFYDSTLGFKMPANLDQPLNTWNSFPSDHVAVFAGLAIVIYIARSRFSFVAIAITVLAELARVYMGAHYPSDLIGGAALASLVVWATQTSWFASLGSRIVVWQGRSPSLFYMSAFLISYQIATLAGDIRWAASILWHR
jgi:undecaprenyl-diphosphatase